MSERPALAVLRADQQSRWRRGERALAERYLDETDWLRDDAESFLDLLYAEVLLREENGERPALEEYQRRFPQLAEPLRRQFAVHEALAEQSAPEETMPALSPDARTPGDAPLAAVPRTIGPYELLGELGRGGMGVVYKARHRQVPGRIAAVKVLRSDEDRARFRTEVQAAAGLTHPNIVVVYDWSEEAEATAYIAMEHVAGGTLAERLAGTPLTPEAAARLLVPLAHAVQHAHEHGVIHRDLKPSNVLLRGPHLPTITDFGLARRLDLGSSLTQTGAVLGTPSYMAPEQARGARDVGPAVDLYGLGAILYECLTGRPPFKADSVLNTLQQVSNAEPVPPRQMQAHVPHDLEVICLKCLHKEPERRYSSATALADDLERWLRGEPILARPPSAIERGRRWLRRHPGRAAVLTTIAAALVLLAGVWWSFTQRLQAETALAQQQRDLATLEKERADQERLKAQQESERASALVQTVLQTFTEHVKVVSQGKERDIRQNNPGGVLFDLACHYADAAKAFRKDTTLAPEQRQRLAEQTQVGAVDLLMKAHDLQHFDRTDNKIRLRSDKRLDPLRPRKEFQALLRRVGS